jgi:signal recognition particle subunit SRP54
MFDALTGKLEGVFKKLRGRGVLKEDDVKEAMREVRLALLEADVNFRVVKEFIGKVQERAVGQEVLASLTPGQQVVKIVHEELAGLLGGAQSKLHLSPNPPTVIMMVGLQGSGKTTTAGKLARNFKKDGRKVLLVPADTRRPAAVEQLKTLARQVGVDAFASSSADPVSICRDARAYAERGPSPVELARQGVTHAKHHALHVAIIDTAGRLQIDEQLMAELRAIKEAVSPTEILMVADAMTGQEAVNIAAGFHKEIGLTGVILTKLDGDARGGAALSIRSALGVPLKFVGVGERPEQFEPFHPDRMAQRILGMGDVLTLIERAGESVDREQAQEQGN